MADRPYRDVKNYKVTVKITYLVDLPLKGRDEDEALDSLEGQVGKLDDYEIVNRSTGRTMEIVEVKEKHGN